MAPTVTQPPITHELCEAFAAAADALQRRRAGDIPEQSIDDFTALQWMDWHGGTLRITPLGHMALIRIRNRLFAQAA